MKNIFVLGIDIQFLEQGLSWPTLNRGNPLKSNGVEQIIHPAGYGSQVTFQVAFQYLQCISLAYRYHVRNQRMVTIIIIMTIVMIILTIVETMSISVPLLTFDGLKSPFYSPKKTTCFRRWRMQLTRQINAVGYDAVRKVSHVPWQNSGTRS